MTITRDADRRCSGRHGQHARCAGPSRPAPRAGGRSGVRAERGASREADPGLIAAPGRLVPSAATVRVGDRNALAVGQAPSWQLCGAAFRAGAVRRQPDPARNGRRGRPGGGDECESALGDRRQSRVRTRDYARAARTHQRAVERRHKDVDARRPGKARCRTRCRAKERSGRGRRAHGLGWSPRSRIWMTRSSTAASTSRSDKSYAEDG
jgi:hypothetical protein